MLAMRRTGVTAFDPLPAAPLKLGWPTRARCLFSDPARYIARTRANPDYGRPGWTRECGRRFHRGLDIAPHAVRPAGRTVTVLFSDCATGREYPSDEPAWIPDDEVFAVLPGVAREVNTDADHSDLGRFVVLEQRWPIPSATVFCLYAHLDEVAVREGRAVEAGARLGTMGQTSRSADARNWMAIAPHLHFEVITAAGGAHDPLAFLEAGLRGL